MFKPEACFDLFPVNSLKKKDKNKEKKNLRISLKTLFIVYALII